MSDLINVFTKLSEFFHPSMLWEEVEALYLKIEQQKSNQPQGSSLDEDVDMDQNSVIACLPIVQRALRDSAILSALLEVSTTIRALRESSNSYDNTYDSWDQVIKVSCRDGYLAFIYTLTGLCNFDPKNRAYRQLSLAASSTYLLSLTIPGAKGFHIFEEEIISTSMQVFGMIEKIQSPEMLNNLPHHHSTETWVNFTSFCDDLKLLFRFVHFNEHKEARNTIMRKLVNMQYVSYERGFPTIYAANLHSKYFEILDEIVSDHNGDPKETLLKIMNMTLFLHTYPARPKSSVSVPSMQSDGCEHISDWYIKMIGKFPRLVSQVLEFFIQCVVTSPEKGWKTEQLQRVLSYAAKYDAALFTRCNASIVEFLSEAVYSDEVSIRSRAVDLLAKIILLESNVDWQMFRHQVSDTPREVYIIKELIDSFRDSNNGIKMKSVQAIQQALLKGSPNARKILTEGIKFAHFNDYDVTLPTEPRIEANEIRFRKPDTPKPAYTFQGVEIVQLTFLDMPRYLYRLLANPLAHLRRAAVILIEMIVKINPIIIFNTNFVQETLSLVKEPTLLVRKQTLVTIDSILGTFPNCYPVIYVWCKIIAPMFQDSDPKNVDLAMECFRNRVLLNIRGIDQTNQAEHFMPWVIVRTLLSTEARLFLQMSLHSALKKQMLNQQILSTIESHILASNSTEAWILLNFICGKIRSKEPDSLIHCFISYHSSPQWNNEQNLLIALEVLNTCTKDFSYTALNNVFKYLLNAIQTGTLLPQVIGKAFDFLITIDHCSKEQRNKSTNNAIQGVEVPSHDWVTDLHNYLEDKLIQEIPNFPENRSIFLSYLFSYSEANLHIRQRPSQTIISFMCRYMMACLKLPEAELDCDNDRLFNSMIVISGRLSIREGSVASTTCNVYGKILRAIDRPHIVNTVLVVVSDLCRKHTQIVESMMDSILQKLSSPFINNREETFNNFASLVLQDQLKLRGSLLLSLLAVVLDENKELSAKARAFFAEFLSKKNPTLFHKCLIECPFVLNEYQNFDGLDSFTENMIKSPLKGDEKLKERCRLYTHLMESIDDIHLILYFGNLKILAEKTQSDPLIKSPEGTALINDILFILKQICEKERKAPEQPNENDDTANDSALVLDSLDQTAADPKPSAGVTAVQGPGRGRGRRRDAPTMNDALTILEKSIVFITTIAEHMASSHASIQTSIDELAKALSLHFPNIIDFAQPAEFWSKYRQGKVTSTPKQKKRSANAERKITTDEAFSEEEFDSDEDTETTPAKKVKTISDALEHMEIL